MFQVVLAVFIERPTPFIEEFFVKLGRMDYPKSKIDLLIHNADEYHDEDVEAFLEESRKGTLLIVVLSVAFKNGFSCPAFHSVTVTGRELGEAAAREKGISLCTETKCDYYFSVDSEAHMDNPNVLRLLMEQNRKVLAPMLTRPAKAWSNFWGALTGDGEFTHNICAISIPSLETLFRFLRPLRRLHGDRQERPPRPLERPLHIRLLPHPGPRDPRRGHKAQLPQGGSRSGHGLLCKPPFQRDLLLRQQQDRLGTPGGRGRLRHFAPSQRDVSDQTESVRLGIQVQEFKIILRM